MTELAVHETAIPGLLVTDLPVHGDNRGWFKENWQREKMVALGLPDFGPVQNNISYNAKSGATRGIHAEPWDKFVSIAHGRIFGAWVDLREGASFGTTFSLEMGPEAAIYVPRGVGNAFQTLVDNTAYSYLVNDHWSAAAKDTYSFVNLGDETLGIEWPIALADAQISDADRNHPSLVEILPVPRLKTLIVGAQGQVGRALVDTLPDADAMGRIDLDLNDDASIDRVNWSRYGTVINAAAFTAVDKAEEPQGRRSAWLTNVTAVGRLVSLARKHRLTLVHLSSDYVFDGAEESYGEDAPFAPLGVYGQTKAAGDALVSEWQRHYIVRTSWVIGEGNNFVRTMAGLADRGVSPAVIDDQVGRLSFTDDIARGISHLLDSEAPFGTYNLTSAGESVSWADIAVAVYTARGREASDVQRTTTDAYKDGRTGISPRPKNSVLELAKIQSTGYRPMDCTEGLDAYLASMPPPRQD